MRDLTAVKAVMRDGKLRTLDEIARELRRRFGRGLMQTTVSARVRDLRKPEYGGFEVQRVATGKRGLWAYRLKRAKA